MLELKTKSKSIRLVYRTKKIVDITNLLKGKNFDDLYFNAVNEGNLDALSKIIYEFAEDEAGLRAFKSSDEVYDFIDDYKEENNKTYGDIFVEIADSINDEGFFKSKMKEKELKDKMSNPFSGVNMTEVVKNSAEKAISKMAETEMFKGYKG